MFGDGLQTRDYVYVGDVVDANLRAASSDVSGAFNIGTGVQTSVLDIVEALAPHAAGDFDGRASATRARARCSTSRSTRARAQAELGWEAQVDLEQGLERTLASLTTV